VSFSRSFESRFLRWSKYERALIFQIFYLTRAALVSAATIAGQIVGGVKSADEQEKARVHLYNE
jgi:hypothetical protein